MDDEQLTLIIAKAAGMQPDEAVDFLTSQGLSSEDVSDAIDTLNQVNGVDDIALDNIAEKESDEAEERVESDEINDLEEQAQNMADGDDTDVSITETDEDNDGDTDTVKVEKKETDDDEVKNPSEEHSEEVDEPNDSDSVPSDKDIDAALDKATSVNLGGIAKTLYSQGGPGRD